MFQLKKVSREGSRVGILEFNGKQRVTPSYFMTSNFGGGASDLYRIVTYIDLLETNPIPTLFNYYYLTIGGTFRVGWIDFISKFGNILDFFSFVRDQFFKKGFVRKNYPKKLVKWQPITMLDSGSGNILRDEIEKGKTGEEILKSLEGFIPKFHTFASKHCFDMMIAMDLARKYTYKKGERKDILYKRLSAEFSRDLSSNLHLLDVMLDLLKKCERKCMVYAPIHGETPEQFRLHTQKILELEKKRNVRFDGFALAGIADYRLKENEIWNIPWGTSSRVKAGLIVSAAARSVRQVLLQTGDTRPVHGLGIGDISNIIPLVASGVDTFDCHTAWRRATDGNMDAAKYVFEGKRNVSFSKFLIPILDSKGEIILQNKEKVFDYIRLPEVSEDIICDCEICRKHSIKEIKELYSNGGEDYYFARILIYVHAILQHDFLCKRLTKEIEDGHSIVEFIKQLPDERLKDDLLTIVNFNYGVSSFAKLNRFIK
jgi:queuine/archaeosine tRNA-ribosyltransferase